MYDEDEYTLNSTSKKIGIDSDQWTPTSPTSGEKSGSGASTQMQTSVKDEISKRITKKFEENAAQSTRAITQNIMPLSEQLTLEKIASIKAKKKALQRKQVSSGVDHMDEDMLGSQVGLLTVN